ncbi:hypothetical protein SAMN02745866_01223 [Alteromonadaceae bacterium Bs31]|nr:hypothetical protein SAMN02745866_01223 [Alteromonadaceae bacterium Bs31]
MNSKGIIALSLGAAISAGTGIAHMSCIFLGPACYKAQLAPPVIVRSAVDGTLLAPVGTVLISSLFFACAIFAASGAGFIKKMPLLSLALLTIAILCVLRGLATIPSSYFFPEFVSTFSLLAGFIWFVTGCLYLYGFYCVRKASL